MQHAIINQTTEGKGDPDFYENIQDKTIEQYPLFGKIPYRTEKYIIDYLKPLILGLTIKDPQLRICDINLCIESLTYLLEKNHIAELTDMEYVEEFEENVENKEIINLADLTSENDVKIKKKLSVKNKSKSKFSLMPLKNIQKC